MPERKFGVDEPRDLGLAAFDPVDLQVLAADQGQDIDGAGLLGQQIRRALLTASVARARHDHDRLVVQRLDSESRGVVAVKHSADDAVQPAVAQGAAHGLSLPHALPWREGGMRCGGAAIGCARGQTPGRLPLSVFGGTACSRRHRAFEPEEIAS